MMPKIISVLLRHKLLSSLIVLVIVALGLFSIRNLPIDAFPDVSPNLVQVFAEVDGMAPEEVEQLVTRPTETAMRSIPGVEKIRSISSLGLSTVNIYFRDDIDIYLARQLVAERLKMAEENIPEGAGLPHGLEMGPVASGMGKILAYYLDAGDKDIVEVRTLHEWVIKRGLETLPGVAKVVSQGGYLKQYEVELSPEKLLAYRLSPLDVSRAIEENNANVGAGVITRESEELIVRTLGRVGTVEEIENVVIKSVDGQPVLVRDVASVFGGKAFRRGVAVLDGEREVVLGGIYKLHRANSFKVITDLRRRIAELNATLPPGIRIVPYYDQAELVASSINTVRNSLILGLILVSVVAFLFLGNLRNALIMVCSMPFSLLFGIIMLERAGMSGDLISLGGMAVALGMIIDAAIIIVEKMQTSVTTTGNEQDVEKGILEAAREVGRPILFAVFVVSVVFFPIFTLGEIEGKMFRPLAFAVVATMAGSLIYALLIAPVFFSLLQRFDKKRSDQGQGKYLGPVLDIYERAVRKAVNRPGRIIGVCLVILAIGVISFTRLGREFIPTLQEGSINCYAYMNPNVSLDEIKKVCTDISLSAKEVPEIKNVVADIGYGEVGPHMHHTNYGCITITLKRRSFRQKRRTQEEIVEALDEKLRNTLGVAIGFSQPIAHELDGLIAGAGAEVVIKIFGDDMDRLKELAGRVEHVVSDISGVSDLRVEQTDGQTQMQVILDDSRLARYGLNKREVQEVVRQALTGTVAGEVFEGQQTFRILVRLDKRFQENRDDLADLLIKGPSGEHLRLGDIAHIKTRTGLRQISRENTQRYISVLCNVRGRDVGTFVVDAKKVVEKADILPPGYRIDWGGKFELQQAANRRLAIVIPVTLIIVVILLYGLFNSIRLTLVILVNIPLALVGGIVALGVLGENISIPSSIGFIALFGIALTDGVVLISKFEQQKERGKNITDAVIAGCRSKFRPVMMTTLTTVLGLVPLVLATGTGSEIQRPLAIVVVFGLITSTVVTLFAVPTIYFWVEKKQSQRHLSQQNRKT
ncbi:MAG: CusA/CzcA family heavy metal efflux RND transporter [Chitinivibrionales bacterium]|nr:CusA/CzcA family heavy metal efflux RND transporter [Chitinivibrionales bacterium]